MEFFGALCSNAEHTLVPQKLSENRYSLRGRLQGQTYAKRGIFRQRVIFASDILLLTTHGLLSVHLFLRIATVAGGNDKIHSTCTLFSFSFGDSCLPESHR